MSTEFSALSSSFDRPLAGFFMLKPAGPDFVVFAPAAAPAAIPLVGLPTDQRPPVDDTAALFPAPFRTLIITHKAAPGVASNRLCLLVQA
jgi:hypothetical protein